MVRALTSVGRSGTLLRMTQLPPRDLRAEVQRHFGGTPEERVLVALQLGEQVLDMFLATQPPGCSREHARRLLQRNRNHGRHRSLAIEAFDR
jgi:hypothetical protein